MKRKEFFVKNSIFHVFNRSISNYKIFSSETITQRFIEVLDYYNNIENKKKFSELNDNEYSYKNLLYHQDKAYVKFISYCIMPDHYHLLIKNNQNCLLSKYIARVENSYAKYFNLKFKRNGPLWSGRFKTVKIENNKQLLHVSRYLHLNPTTSNLVQKPENWYFSSYKDLISNKKILKGYIKEISISTSVSYKKFVENNKDYQRKLKLIKKLLLE